ncbi:MAG: NAD-dependent epimerase/dehydratase family protein [Pirellulaceae bacterium]
MNVLVTGATGLVGNNVVRLLLEQGHQVRVLVRPTADRRSLEGLELEIIPGDVTDTASLTTACQHQTHVIHSAAMVHIGWTGAEAMHQVNVGGTEQVAQAALAAGARLVHVSSVDALGVGRRDQPANEESPRTGKVECPYVQTKRAAEERLQTLFAAGLPGLIVNPGFMLGPWDWKPSSGKMLLEFIKNRPPMAPRGGCSVADVRDVAQAIVNACTQGQTGHNYILGGENLRYVDLWRRFAKITGTRAPFSAMGPLVAKSVGLIGDLTTNFKGQEAEFNSAAIRMSDQYHYYDSSKAKMELGYQSRPTEEAIEAAWGWFKEYGYLPT